MKQNWLRTDINLKIASAKGKNLKNATYSVQKLGKMGPKKCQTPKYSRLDVTPRCTPHEVMSKTYK